MIQSTARPVVQPFTFEQRVIPHPIATALEVIVTGTRNVLDFAVEVRYLPLFSAFSLFSLGFRR
jgi:hypothetical protein